jgi:hypothetical protein
MEGCAMSLGDVVGNVLGTVTPDPETARRPMLDKIAAVRREFADGGAEGVRSGWVSADPQGRVAFGPTRPDGQQMVIGGQSVTFWSTDEFPAVLEAFERAVAAGELDGQLLGGTPAGSSLPLDRLTPSTQG